MFSRTQFGSSEVEAIFKEHCKVASRSHLDSDFFWSRIICLCLADTTFDSLVFGDSFMTAFQSIQLNYHQNRFPVFVHV